MILALEGLDAFYGAAQTLFRADLTVASGEVVALLGRNGAGKSTLLKAVVGLGPERRGRVLLDGKDVVRLRPDAVVRLGIGYVPEDRRVFSDLTVDENLEVGRRPARDGRAAWNPERLFAVFPNLAGLRGRRGREMSGGEQQMLAVARTLMGNPAIVLLDEPSEGLAPLIVEQMADAVVAMKRDGVGVLMSEQNVLFAEAVLDRSYLIDRGIVRPGAGRQDLLARPDALRHALAV